MNVDACKQNRPEQQRVRCTHKPSQNMNKELTRAIKIMSACTLSSMILSLVFFSSLFAESGSAQKLNEVEFSIDMEYASVLEVFEEIETRTDYKFLYNGSVTDQSNRQVTLKFSEATLEQVLLELASQTGTAFRQIGYTIAAGMPEEYAGLEDVIQQQVTGRVLDSETQEALPGVNIVVQGTTTGTTTNVNGNFELGVPDLQQTLVISYIGYNTQTIAINGRNTLDIQLEPALTGLDELVVVGYGVQRRSDLTGSISSVGRSELGTQSVSNVTQSLQGRVAGVDIRHSSGEPGAPMEIQIRGVGTFGNNDPLYVIDGMPAQSEDWSALNPNDIESLEILKDASAAAIYGARAANGVVLITTRRGMDGAPQVEYDGSYAFQRFNDFENLLNSEQYAMLSNESAQNDGRSPEPAFSDPQNIAHNSPWQEEAFQTAPMMDHNLSIRGGTQNARYMVSGNYLNQEGVFVHNYLKRYSTRINTEFDLSDRLTVGQTLNISRVGALNRNQSHNTPYTYLLGGSPTMRIYKPENEGGYGGPNPAETGVNSRANIIGQRDIVRNYSNTNRLLGEVNANLEILDNLTYRFRVGLNASTGHVEQFNPTYNMDGRSNQRASMSETRSEGHEMLVENTMTYAPTLPGGHPMTVLAGYTEESSDQRFTSAGINEFPSNDLRVIGAGSGDMSANGGRQEWALRSFFGRVNTTLFDKYLLSATIRRDGSSRFGADHRYGNFPSFAAGWFINRESFMPDLPFINELKLRGSWGRLGNQQIGNYVNQSLVSIDGIFYVLGGSPAAGAAVNSLGNPQIRWETTTQTDLGFDLAMFNNRLLFVADYYMKDTEDILLRVPISTATGIGRGSGPFQNAASMKNSGFEFELTYRETLGDLSYRVSGNFSTIKNEVTGLGGESAIIDFVENAYGYGVYTYTTIGDPISSFYGWQFDGIFQNQAEINNGAAQGGAQPGDVRFRDLNGDGEITDDDRTVIGSPIPDFTYGISGSVGYKNLDLSLSITGVHGRDIYNANRAFLENGGMEWNQRTTMLDRWTGEGSSTTTPRVSRNAAFSNTRPQDRFVENGSYLRLQTLQIGYTAPDNLLGQLGIRNLRVYLHTQNLLTISGYSGWNPDVRGGSGGSSPDVGNPLVQGVDLGTYPLPKIYQLGLQLGF